MTLSPSNRCSLVNLREKGGSFMLDAEALEKVKEVFAETLKERFDGELDFGPIVVTPDVDWCGEDYLRVLIVVDGDMKRLDPTWTVSLIRRVRPKLAAVGVTEFPSPSFIGMKGYKSALRRGRVDKIG